MKLKIKPQILKRLFSREIVTALVILMSVCNSLAEEIFHTKCGNLENPTGLLLERLKFSWKLKFEKQGEQQTAYQILISDDLNKLDSDEGNSWNSEKVASDAAIQFAYEGKSLLSAKKYFWKVKVWDHEGLESDWSEPANFTTALFNDKDWSNAKWLVYEEMPDSLRLVPGIHELRSDFKKNTETLGQKRYVTPYFRKKFAVTKKVKTAFVAVSGLGHYELSLNGEKVSNRFLAPGWTQYDKTCLYNMYEDTEQLQKGENAIEALVGNGFYNINTQRYIKFTITYGSPTLICKLKITYEDGSVETIASDDTWKSNKSPITFTSFFGGENYDDNLEQVGWDGPGFDDSTLKKVLISNGSKGELKVEMDYPLQVMGVFDTPIIKRPEGIYLYDFKQNVSGIVKLKGKEKKGQTLILHPAERLIANGLMNQQTSGTPVWFQYTQKGGDEEFWVPKFTYYGFRYVEVEGAEPKGKPNPESLPVITELQSLHTRSSLPTVGSFNYSNKLFNRTNKLIDWSVKSNLASVTTDCPYREKLGWLALTHLMGNSIKHTYDIYNLYDKIVDDMIDSQTANGLISDISPEYVEFSQGFRDSPEWGSSSIMLPWYLYKWYGDTKAMERVYPMMKEYMAYLESKADNHILDHGLGDWYDLEPKSPGATQLTPKPLTAIAIYFLDLKLLSEMAQMIDHKKDTKHFRELAELVRVAFNVKFFNMEKMSCATGSQTSNAMPLYLGMVDEKYLHEVTNNLGSALKQNNFALTSGDVGYRYLLQILQKSGFSDIIYKMNNRSDIPGYGYQIEKEATSLTELWNAKDASHNYMMLCYLTEWFYSVLGGVGQTENSVTYKKISIASAMVDGISDASTSYGWPYRLIKCNWVNENNIVKLNLYIPVNTTALIHFNITPKSIISVGDRGISDVKNIVVISKNSNKMICKVGSGIYLFKIK